MTGQKKNLKTASVHYKNTDLKLKMIKKAKISRVRVPLNRRHGSCERDANEIIETRLDAIALSRYFYRNKQEKNVSTHEER
jgi:hypothetical protein